jgi:hypothetical protein
MKKIALPLVLVILISLSFSGCLGDKGKFVGTWQYSEGGSITFYDNNSVSITNIQPLGVIQLDGLFTYSIATNNVTFTSSGSSGVSVNIAFAYSFPNDNTLVLTRSGISLTLVKTT